MFMLRYSWAIQAAIEADATLGGLVSGALFQSGDCDAMAGDKSSTRHVMAQTWAVHVYNS